MPNWNQVLDAIQECENRNPVDFARSKYMRLRRQKTGRKMIC